MKKPRRKHPNHRPGKVVTLGRSKNPPKIKADMPIWDWLVSIDNVPIRANIAQTKLRANDA